MPCFFFNIRTKTDFIQDLEGQEFASLNEVLKEAIVAAREIMKLRAGEEHTSDRFEIRDIDQQLVFVLPFRALMQSEN